jgi:hypothetical protein
MLLVRVLFSALLLVCFSHVVGFRFSDEPERARLPLRIERLAGQNVFVVRARADVPLPPPLVDGAIVEVGRMSVLDRAVVLDALPVAAGTPVTLVVQQEGQERRATFVPPPAPEPRTQTELLQLWSGHALLTIVLGMALLTLWRGHDWTAWGLCVFSSGIVLDNSLQVVVAPASFRLWLDPLRAVLQLLWVSGPYITAECLAGSGLSRVFRRLSRAFVAGAILAALATHVVNTIWLIHSGAIPAAWLSGLEDGSFGALLVMAFIVLLAGYGRGTPEGRRRMRWALASTAALMLAVLLQILFVPTMARQPALTIALNIMLPGVAVLGYLYSILRTRVVDVGFVIDRALVFSGTAALMFGMFSLLEQAVHRLALGEQLGWMAQALGAVGVAAILRPLHRGLDWGLERVFFHRLRTMAGALRRLGTESAFFESEDTLLSRVLGQVLEPCATAAIYERDGAVYQRRAAHGEGWPATLDRDEPIFVTLRAQHGVLELKNRKSGAGAEGLAFPMGVGPLLTGAVICRLREGEQLDRDVRSALGELAHALGTALYMLRYREQARFIAEIAAGDVDHAAVRTRAASLLGMG